MTEKPVGIVIPTWNPNEPRFIVTEATPYLSENRVFRNGKCVENQRLKIVFSVDEIVDGFNALDDEIDRLKNENEQLRQQLQEKQEDEKEYAREILRLNKLVKEYSEIRQLGGDY